MTNFGWVGHDPETCVSDSGGELIHSETKDLIERFIANGKKIMCGRHILIVDLGN